MFPVSEYVRHDGLGLAALVRGGEVSATELLEAAITRIETLNPALNAVIRTRFEQARAEANRVDLQRHLPVCPSSSRTCSRHSPASRPPTAPVCPLRRPCPATASWCDAFVLLASSSLVAPTRPSSASRRTPSRCFMIRAATRGQPTIRRVAQAAAPQRRLRPAWCRWRAARWRWLDTDPGLVLRPLRHEAQSRHDADRPGVRRALARLCNRACAQRCVTAQPCSTRPLAPTPARLMPLRGERGRFLRKSIPNPSVCASPLRASHCSDMDPCMQTALQHSTPAHGCSSRSGTTSRRQIRASITTPSGSHS